MNLVTLFLTIGCIYLVIVAYGVVRTRKKGLPPRLRFISAGLQVAIPPAALFAALIAAEGGASGYGGWGILFLMLAIAGGLLAICTDLVARRVL